METMKTGYFLPSTLKKLNNMKLHKKIEEIMTKVNMNKIKISYSYIINKMAVFNETVFSYFQIVYLIFIFLQIGQ